MAVGHLRALWAKPHVGGAIRQTRSLIVTVIIVLTDWYGTLHEPTSAQEIEVNVGGRLNSSTESPRQTLELMADNGAMGVETRITDSGRRIVGRGISELSWKMPVNSSDQSFSSTWYAQ